MQVIAAVQTTATPQCWFYLIWVFTKVVYDKINQQNSFVGRVLCYSQIQPTVFVLYSLDCLIHSNLFNPFPNTYFMQLVFQRFANISIVTLAHLHTWLSGLNMFRWVQSGIQFYAFIIDHTYSTSKPNLDFSHVRLFLKIGYTQFRMLKTQETFSFGFWHLHWRDGICFRMSTDFVR